MRNPARMARGRGGIGQAWDSLGDTVTPPRLSGNREARDVTYHIIKTRTGFYVAELGADDYLHPLHDRPMNSAEAAARLRDDLANDRCPLDMTPSPSDGFDPGEHAARCYDVAVRIIPLLGDDPEAWAVALRIADARPWETPGCALAPADDSELLF